MATAHANLTNIEKTEIHEALQTTCKKNNQLSTKNKTKNKNMNSKHEITPYLDTFLAVRRMKSTALNSIVPVMLSLMVYDLQLLRAN